MSEKDHNLLIQLAIKKGFASASSVKSALDEVKAQKQRGDKPDFRAALTQKGVLTDFQIDFLMKQVKEKGELKEHMDGSDDSLIEGYEIISNLGMGGMGTVYKARQIAMDRLVALKVLKEELSNNPKYVSRFMKEAKSAAALNHQNIVNVYDVGKSSGLYYLAMEYIDGETLKSLLEKEKQMDPIETLEYGMQCARALNHMEKARVIHRDIKPDNIMITKDGVAKLADLGIAKREEDKGATQTKKGFVVGTFEYMSPEQASAKVLDYRSDMYSMGVTLYTVMTGENPFLGTTPSETVQNVMNKRPPSMKHYYDHGAAELDELIGGMIQKDREDRFADSSELIRAMQDTLYTLRHPRQKERDEAAAKQNGGAPTWLVVVLFFIIVGLVGFIVSQDMI